MWQVLSIWRHIDQLEAAQKGVLAVFRRAMERKTYRERQEIEVSKEEVGRELEKQLRLLDHEATRKINQRLKAENLPPELRQLMEDVLFDKKHRN